MIHPPVKYVFMQHVLKHSGDKTGQRADGVNIWCIVCTCVLMQILRHDAESGDWRTEYLMLF